MPKCSVQEFEYSFSLRSVINEHPAPSLSVLSFSLSLIWFLFTFLYVFIVHYLCVSHIVWRTARMWPTLSLATTEIKVHFRLVYKCSWVKTKFQFILELKWTLLNHCNRSALCFLGLFLLQPHKITAMV